MRSVKPLSVKIKYRLNFHRKSDKELKKLITFAITKFLIYEKIDN